jgi:hypothetical protein
MADPYVYGLEARWGASYQGTGPWSLKNPPVGGAVVWQGGQLDDDAGSFGDAAGALVVVEVGGGVARRG